MFDKYQDWFIPLIGGILMSVVVGLAAKDTAALLVGLTAAMTTLIFNLSIRIEKLKLKIDRMEKKL